MRALSFWPDPQQTLLLHAVLDEPSRARASVERWLATVDFEAIDAGSQRLLPLLHTRIKSFGIEHPLAGRIQGIYRRNWYLDQRLRHQLRVVRAAFRGAYVNCILLKGAALGPEVYGHGALRPSDDVDLLVRPADFERATTLLVASGWRLHPRGGAGKAHAHTFISDIGDVDLHVSPFHEDAAHPALAGLWADSRVVTIDGEPAHLLAAHDQLLHTLTHGLRANTVSPIRWVADTVMSVSHYSAHLDWDRFARRAEELEFTFIACKGLAYLAREFDVPVPASCLDRLRRNRRALPEWVDYHFGRQDRFMPIAMWAASYRSAKDATQLTRWRMVASAYSRHWKDAGTTHVAFRACLRIVLGRRLTAWIYKYTASA